MVFVTEIRLSGGEGHEHIAEVRWRNPEDGKIGTTTRQGMVDWISRGGKAYVANNGQAVEVHVVNAEPPYIQTYADGAYTDNLLALPHY